MFGHFKKELVPSITNEVCLTLSTELISITKPR
jgi:hypothetical protein